MRPSNGNSRSDLNIFFVHSLLEQPRCEMSVRIHCNDLLLIVPLRERPNVCSGLSVGEVGLVRNVEVLAGYSERVVNRI